MKQRGKNLNAEVEAVEPLLPQNRVVRGVIAQRVPLHWTTFPVPLYNKVWK